MSLIKEKWFINEGELDDEQYNIKRMSLNNSYIVKGCAGSGKTVLAIWRAIEIIAKNEQCYILVYTNALKQFIVDALSLNPATQKYVRNVRTYAAWKNAGQHSATHIIVDEAQDFGEKEIKDLKLRAETSIALYGDSAQKLYPIKRVTDFETGVTEQIKTLTVEEISVVLDLPVKVLKLNYRLPKKIASFAQTIQSDSLSLASQCKKEGDAKPRVIKCNTDMEELDYILTLISSKGLVDVGILLPDNETIDKVYKILLSKGVTCEIKYNHESDYTKNVMNLSFLTDHPKLITYHSSKGLQFDNVFIPFCSKFNGRIKERAPLYVACTRASQELTITCTQNVHSFLEEIPPNLYEVSDFVTIKAA